MYSITAATRKIAALKSRIKAVPGGTSAGKTIGILEVLIDKCQRDTLPTITSVVSETFPHLKRGAIRDFLSIMEEQGYYADSRWNKSDFIYTFETGAKIEFFSADQPGKVRGPRRNRLFVNEANNIPYETFDQLEIRTNDEIFLDWNPTTEFWYYDKLRNRSDVEELTLTYLDNQALNPAIVASIEAHKGDKMWWQVYGLGQLGEVETQIYRGWKLDVDDVPFEARLERYGLDFGYTNDPTAIIAVYYYNGGYILDEIAYQAGLLNKPISDILLNQSRALVIADAAEPKSIDEIRLHGISIMPCQKGKGSVNRGIGYVQQQKISVTKRSVNLIREYRNYVWITDKDGRVINEPIDINNHAMDAIRYAIASIKDPNQMNANVRYSASSMPKPMFPLAPELQDKPRYAQVYVPRL